MRHIRSTRRALESHQTVERAIGLARSAQGVLWSGHTKALDDVSQWSSGQSDHDERCAEIADEEVKGGEPR